MAEDKKTLSAENPTQNSELNTKNTLSEIQDITETTRIEMAEEQDATVSSSKPKQLKLEELITMAGKFVRGKAKSEDLDAFGEKMVIRSYIPILEKVRSLMMLIYKLDNDPLQTSEVRIANVNKTLFFDVLLGMYGMVDVSNDELKTYAAYDLLYPVFAPFLLQYCGFDYNEYKKMFEDSVNITHLHDLSEMLSSVDYKKLAEQNKKVEALMDEIKNNQELIKNLNELMATTDPNLKNTMDVIKKNMVSEILSASKGERELKAPEAKKIKTKKTKSKKIETETNN